MTESLGDPIVKYSSCELLLCLSKTVVELLVREKLMAAGIALPCGFGELRTEEKIKEIVWC